MKKTHYLIILIIGLLSHDIHGQDKQIGEIPFTISGSGFIIVELHINKEKVSNFILDTGASVTVLDDDLATQMNLSLLDEEFKSTGANGVSENGKKTAKQEVIITDKVVLEGIELTIMDLSHIGIGEINGIIGFDLFREFVSEINFDTKKVIFYEKKGKPKKDGYQAVKFVESFCTPEVNISFSLENGERFKGKALFDTGNTSTPLIINAPYKIKQDLLPKFKSLITYESKGINSASQSDKGVIASMKLGGYELGEMPVGLSNVEQGVLSWEGYLGIIGLEYISKFNVIIDYHRKKIYLKPNNSFSNSFEFPLSGIALKEENGETFIKSISRPSSAYDQGLRAGQKLISINGVEGRNKFFYANMLKTEGEEVTIVVQLENAELKTVKILLKRLI